MAKYRPDSVERSAIIAAPAEKIYPLVQTPGWYISDEDGDKSPQTIAPMEDGHLLVDPRYGQFFIRVLEDDAPSRHVSTCVFAAIDAEMKTDAPGSTIRVTLRPVDEGTRVTIVESGFAAMFDDDVILQAMIDGNAAGWDKALKWLTTHSG